METNNENRDYESSMLKDWMKVLQRCFFHGFAGTKKFPRKKQEMDHLIEITGIKQETVLPLVFQFIKDKTVLLCEVKTPGTYLDLEIFTQMLDYQVAYMNHLKQTKNLRREIFKEVVIIVLVSEFSESMKDWLRKERGVNFQVVEKGLYKFPGIMDHYALVLDELGIDLATLELLKYTKNSNRVLEIVAWIRDHVEKEKQSAYIQDIIEIHPELLEEINKMIPVSQNPEENKDYIRRFFIGFGPEAVTYVAKNSREDVIREAMQDSKKEVIRQVMKDSKEDVINQLVEEQKGPDVLDGLTQSGFSLEQIQKYLDSKKKN